MSGSGQRPKRVGRRVRYESFSQPAHNERPLPTDKDVPEYEEVPDEDAEMQGEEAEKMMQETMFTFDAFEAVSETIRDHSNRCG